METGNAGYEEKHLCMKLAGAGLGRQLDNMGLRQTHGNRQKIVDTESLQQVMLATEPQKMM